MTNTQIYSKDLSKNLNFLQKSWKSMKNIRNFPRSKPTENFQFLEATVICTHLAPSGMVPKRNWMQHNLCCVRDIAMQQLHKIWSIQYEPSLKVCKSLQSSCNSEMQIIYFWRMKLQFIFSRPERWRFSVIISRKPSSDKWQSVNICVSYVNIFLCQQFFPIFKILKFQKAKLLELDRLLSYRFFHSGNTLFEVPDIFW